MELDERILKVQEKISNLSYYLFSFRGEQNYETYSDILDEYKILQRDLGRLIEVYKRLEPQDDVELAI
ncbi:MAG: hypothetical protein GY756_24915 [bacterium]|nr:hypothetical protein [bacterium]